MGRTLHLALLLPLALLACRAKLPAELDGALDPARQVGVGPIELLAPGVGDPAPSFELPDLQDRLWRLSDLEGRVVVLLWFDAECPFLEYAYERADLARRARSLAEEGVIWLAIDSDGAGRAGRTRDVNLSFAARHDLGHPILLDGSGMVGRAFGVLLAGEVLILAPDGTIFYRGSLDNAPFGVPRQGSRLEPYLDRALEALARGEAPASSSTEPYGCRIRYAQP